MPLFGLHGHLVLWTVVAPVPIFCIVTCGLLLIEGTPAVFPKQYTAVSSRLLAKGLGWEAVRGFSLEPVVGPSKRIPMLEQGPSNGGKSRTLNRFSGFHGKTSPEAPGLPRFLSNQARKVNYRRSDRRILDTYGQ